MLFMTVFKSRMYNSTQIATCSECQAGSCGMSNCRCPRLPLGSCELLCYVAGSSSIINGNIATVGN